MNKAVAAISLLLAVSLAGCSSGQAFAVRERERYEASFLELFDTVTVIKGYAESKEEFTEESEKLYAELERYNRLFDIYNDYEGVSNLKTVNDSAGKEPVEVSPELIRVLEFGKEAYEESSGKVNIFMGSVLSLWHEARETSVEDPEEAYIPAMEDLEEAAKHTDPANVIIDAEKNTVYLKDPEQSIDAGAIAKGYAAQRALDIAPEGYVLSLGGNICISGPKADGSEWIVGIQDPDSENYLEKLSISKGSVVTSGDYQRYYILNGVRYHHIIDPDTLMPADRWRSVTIIADDSGIADFLSTALFMMSREEGTELLQKYGAEAYWIDTESRVSMTDGFRTFIKP